VTDDVRKDTSDEKPKISFENDMLEELWNSISEFLPPKESWAIPQRAIIFEHRSFRLTAKNMFTGLACGGLKGRSDCERNDLVTLTAASSNLLLPMQLRRRNIGLRRAGRISNRKKRAINSYIRTVSMGRIHVICAFREI
jgi:hypothetical protein